MSFDVDADAAVAVAAQPPARTYAFVFFSESMHFRTYGPLRVSPPCLIN